MPNEIPSKYRPVDREEAILMGSPMPPMSVKEAIIYKYSSPANMSTFIKSLTKKELLSTPNGLLLYNWLQPEEESGETSGEK